MNTIIKFSGQKNLNLAPRTGVLTIAQRPVVVAQRGVSTGSFLATSGGISSGHTGPCFYSVAPSNFLIPWNGGKYQTNLTFTSGCSWTKSSNVPWLVFI